MSKSKRELIENAIKSYQKFNSENKNPLVDILNKSYEEYGVNGICNLIADRVMPVYKDLGINGVELYFRDHISVLEQTTGTSFKLTDKDWAVFMKTTEYIINVIKN